MNNTASSPIAIICASILGVFALNIPLVSYAESASGKLAQQLIDNDTSKQQKKSALENITAMTESLIEGERNYLNISEMAQHIRQAIMRKDYSTAQDMLEDGYKKTSLTGLEFEPYTRLIRSVMKTSDEDYERNLDEWVERGRKDSVPMILRSQYYFNKGWKIRGKRYISYIEKRKVKAFRENMAMAKKDILAAISIDENNPISWHLLLAVLMGGGNSSEMETAFQQAIKAVPGYYKLYEMRLRTLQPKWGGSVEEMYQFVNAYAGKAAQDSPLKMLNLALYSYLIDVASLTCERNSGDALEECVSKIMSTAVTEELATNVNETLKFAKEIDELGFAREVGDLILSNLNSRGVSHYNWMLLQLAGESLRTRNKADPNAEARSNFIMDRVSGMMQLSQNDTQGAIYSLMAAIDNLRARRSLDEHTMHHEMAMIYDDLAEVLYRTDQNERAIAYQRVAEYLAGTTRDGKGRSMQCHALFNLKLYEEAVRVCTSEVEENGHLSSALWRAYSYLKLGESDKAIADMTLLADSEEKYREYAALHLVRTAGIEGDREKQLALFSRYQYLFDENVTGKSFLAEAYSSRCYLNKLLGNYEQALDDCTASLKYKPTKYAYGVQRSVVKILDNKKSREQTAVTRK